MAVYSGLSKYRPFGADEEDDPYTLDPYAYANPQVTPPPFPDASTLAPPPPPPTIDAQVRDRLAKIGPPPAPPKSNAWQTVASAVLNASKLRPAADAIVHPKYTAQRKAYEEKLGDEAEKIKLENQAENTAALGEQRRAMADYRKSAGDAAQQRNVIAALDSKRRAFKTVVGTQRPAYVPTSAPVPPGFTALEDPDAPEGMRAVVRSGLQTAPKELVDGGYLPGVKMGDPVPLDEYQKALEAMYAAKKQAEKPTAPKHLVPTRLTNPITGDVITKWSDPETGVEVRRDVDKGVAPARPSQTFINTDAGKAAIEEAARAIAGGDYTRLREVSSMRGDQRLLLFARVKQLNPKFNTAEVDRKIKNEDYYANGKGADNLRSFGTFLEHGGEASDAVNGIRLNSSPIINKPLNWWRKNASGSPEYQRLITALEPVRKEFESFLLGGRALYGEDRRSAETILNDDSSPAQIQAALKAMGHTADARFREENYRYKKVSGRDLQDPFSPEALTGAQKMGIRLGQPQSEGGGAIKVRAGDGSVHPFTTEAEAAAFERLVKQAGGTTVRVK